MVRVLIPHIDILTDADFARFFDRPRTEGTHLRLAERTRARLEPQTRIAGKLRERLLAMPRTAQEQLDHDIAEIESQVKPRGTSALQKYEQDVADIQSGQWAADHRLDPQDVQAAVHGWLTETATLLSDLYDAAYQDGRANFAEQHPQLVSVDDMLPDESDSPDDEDLKDSAMRNHFASLGKMANEIMNISFAGQLLGWFNQNEGRVNLQAGQVAWAGEQHGYKEAGVGKGLEIDWELDDGADHCNDCPDLADGGPYTDDGGDNPLPTTPGSGDTQCQGNCRCSLNYRTPEPVGLPGDDEDLAPEHAEEDVAQQLGIDLADFGGAEKGGLAGSAMWVQNAIANLDREVGMSFDAQGHVLGAHIGTSNSIVFQRAQIQNMKGAQLSVHNHPGGQSFSPADVAFAHAMRFGELDVFTPQHTFMLRPAKGKFDPKFGKKVIDRAEVVADQLLVEVEAKAQADFAAQLKGVFKYGQPLAWSDFWRLETQDFWHTVWTKVAPEFKLQYSRVAAPGYIAKKLPKGDVGKAPWSGMPPSKIPVDMVKEEAVPAPKALGGLPADFPQMIDENIFYGTNGWQAVAGPSGSQQGFWRTNKTTGKTYYIKPQASEERAMNEAGTMLAYEAMGAVPGVDIPFVTALNGMSNKWYVVSQRMDDPLKAMTTSWWQLPTGAPYEAKESARKLWAADALLSHYDVVGMANDNLLVRTVKNGLPSVVRIEGGAGMKFRAQGGIKPNWTPSAQWDEPWSMRGKAHGAAPGSGQAGPVFGSITNSQAAGLIEKLGQELTPQKVEALRQAWVAMGMPALQAQENIDVIKARLIQIPKVVAELKGEAAMPTVTVVPPHAPEPVKLPPEPVVKPPEPPSTSAPHALALQVVAQNKPLYDKFIATKMDYKGGAFNYTIDKATPEFKNLPYSERAKIAFAQWLKAAKTGDWSEMPPKVKSWFQAQSLEPATAPAAKPEATIAPKLNPNGSNFDAFSQYADSYFQQLQSDLGGFSKAKDEFVKVIAPQLESAIGAGSIAYDDALELFAKVFGMSAGDAEEEINVIYGPSLGISAKAEPFSTWQDVADAATNAGLTTLQGDAETVEDAYKTWLHNPDNVSDAVNQFFAKHAEAINVMDAAVESAGFSSWSDVYAAAKGSLPAKWTQADLESAYQAWLKGSYYNPDVDAFFTKHADALDTLHGETFVGAGDKLWEQYVADLAEGKMFAGGTLYPYTYDEFKAKVAEWAADTLKTPGIKAWLGSPNTAKQAKAFAWNKDVLHTMWIHDHPEWATNSLVTKDNLWKQYYAWLTGSKKEDELGSGYVQWFKQKTLESATKAIPQLAFPPDETVLVPKAAAKYPTAPIETSQLDPIYDAFQAQAMLDSKLLTLLHQGGMAQDVFAFADVLGKWTVNDASILNAPDLKAWLDLNAPKFLKPEQYDSVRFFTTPPQWLTPDAAAAKQALFNFGKGGGSMMTAGYGNFPTTQQAQAAFKKAYEAGAAAGLSDAEMASQYVDGLAAAGFQTKSKADWTLTNWKAMKANAGVVPTAPTINAPAEAVAKYATLPTYGPQDIVTSKKASNYYVKPHDGGPVIILGNTAALTKEAAVEFANIVAGWQVKAPQLFSGLKRISFIGSKSYFKADEKVLVMDKTIHGHLVADEKSFWKGVGLKVDLEHTAWTGELNQVAGKEMDLADSFATYMTGQTQGAAVDKFWGEKIGLPKPEAAAPATWGTSIGGMKVQLATKAWLEGKDPLDVIAVALKPELGSADAIADHLYTAAINNAPTGTWPGGGPIPTTEQFTAKVNAALGIVAPPEVPTVAPPAPAEKPLTGMEAMKADALKWTEGSDPEGTKFVADHPSLWTEFKASKMGYKGGGFNWAIQTLTTDLPKGTSAKVRQQVALARLFKLYHTEPDKLKSMVPKVYKWLGNAIEGMAEDSSAWATTPSVGVPAAAIKAKLEPLPTGWETKPVLQQTNVWMQNSMPNSRVVYENWKATAGGKAQLNAWVRTLLGLSFKAEIDATGETGDAYYKLRGLAFTKSYLMAKAGMFDELARISPNLRDYWKDILFPPPPKPLPPGMAPWASRLQVMNPGGAVRNKLITEIERDLQGHPDKLESWRALKYGTDSWKGGSQSSFHAAGERVIAGQPITDSTMKGAAAMWNTIRDAKPTAPELGRSISWSGVKADIAWWQKQIGKTIDMQLSGFSDSGVDFAPSRNTRYVLAQGSQAFSTLAFTEGFTGEREWIVGGRFKVVKAERKGGRNYIYIEWVAPDRTGPSVLHERL